MSLPKARSACCIFPLCFHQIYFFTTAILVDRHIALLSFTLLLTARANNQHGMGPGLIPAAASLSGWRTRIAFCCTFWLVRVLPRRPSHLDTCINKHDCGLEHFGSRAPYRVLPLSARKSNPHASLFTLKNIDSSVS